MTRDEWKKVVSEAIQEWLDKQFALLGKWAFRSILAAGLAALVWLILIKGGWTPPGVH